ncbi:MAG: hypothetical protein H7175_03620, partial [Burkholderiales bacterium]|nr:hypothetical protein [Anaerolineae bacterium]
MLVRAYRLTDRMGVVLLKSSLAFSDTTLAGIHIIVSAVGRALGVVFGALFALLALLFGSRGAVSGPARRVSGSAARAAGASAGGVMARRAARAQMEVGLAEDP